MPKGAYKHYSRQLFQKGNKYLFKKGHKIRSGMKHKEKTKEKIKKSKLGQKHSEETKEKMKLARLERKEKLGYINSPETRKKLSLILKGRAKSEEHRRKLSIIFQGENSSLWCGGKSFEPYSKDWTKLLRKIIRGRDGYICQLCGKHGNDVHHIDYDKKNCNPNNLIILCRACHRKTNFNRQYWTKYIYERAKNDLC